MIRCVPVPEPTDWQAECAVPGRAWLRLNPGARRPEDLWTGKDRKFRNYLRDGLGGRCAYTALPEANGQMDHFEPWANLRSTPNEARAYAWDNFRYACGRFNQAKGPRRVPDPYMVQDDWFEIELPSLALRATSRVPAAHAAEVATLLKILGTDDRATAPRRAWLEMYQQGELSFEGLERHAPMLAAALRRQPSFLRPADAVRLGLAPAVTP